MKTSTGFEQCYNAQIAADGTSRLIVGTLITNCAADVEALLPTIEAAEASTGKATKLVLADAGYRSEENLAALESAGIDGYIAIGREGKSSSTPGDRFPATKKMKRKLKSKRGRLRYRERKHLVEPVFGWLKNVIGFRAFSMRGMRKVAGEFDLVSLALNLRRMSAMGG